MEKVWNLPSCCPPQFRTNPFLSAALKIWDTTHPHLVNATSLLSTFLRQHWFVPALPTDSFHIWKSFGLTRLIGVTTNGKILEKVTLEWQIDHKLPWFQYLQLSHLISHLTATKSLNSNLIAFESLLYQGTIGMKGYISAIYKSLLQVLTNRLLSYAASWNNEELLVLTMGTSMGLKHQLIKVPKC